MFNSTDNTAQPRKSKLSTVAPHGFVHPFSRWANPRKWSLRAKVLHVSGLLLALGCAFQIVFLSMVLSESVQVLARKRIAQIRSSVSMEMDHVRTTALSHAMALSSMPLIREMLADDDREGLRIFLLPYSDSLRLALGMGGLDIFVLKGDGQVLLRTDRPNALNGTLAGDELQELVAGELRMTAILDAAEDTLLMRAVSPVVVGDDCLGSVEVRVDLGATLRSLDLAPDESISVYRAVFPATEEGDGGGPDWEFMFGSGAHPPVLERSQAPFEHLVRQGDDFHLANQLVGLDRAPVAALAAAYDASSPIREGSNRIYQLGALFIPGALFLWLVLYANVSRIESFLAQLKKIIVASHSNDFRTRFETDTVHCLEVMNCHNEECPVYQDPSRVCYLETGSEAISPRWRNTCLFLKRYGHCRNCPVYHLRMGDEIEEMRGVVNTFMRLWSKFLGRTGHLLAYVLRSQEQAGRLPSLDEVSDRLEQMAKLTFFSHDLQGTLNKEEVYLQLSHVVEENFHIRDYVLFSFEHETGHSEIALDTIPARSLCRHDVLVSPDLCRANRVAEEVTSFHNPTLCPYFHCESNSEFRTCLPMVMNGKVGGVFSFLLPRDRWAGISDMMPMLRKYLTEASPVLSSLRLLDLSREKTLRDPLTGCHNRRFLDEFISKYEPLSQREGHMTGLLMCDLDYFKQVNDQYGHDAGDVVLKQVVSVIRGVIRRSDLVIRYGGEEFLVLLLEVEEGMADAVAEKIRKGVEEERLNLPGEVFLHKTISVGVAEFPTDGDTLYKTIKFADVALYEAKRRGRNRIQHFEPDMWEGSEY